MRLIDADEFIKKFKYASADTEEQKIMCTTVRRMIKEQPTAYDVDTVVNQLELYSFEFGTNTLPAHYVRLSDAIAIVRDVGTNENNIPKVKMVKYEEDYVPEELCTIDRLGGIDDVLPCSESCRQEDCATCVVTRVFNDYAKITKQEGD